MRQNQGREVLPIPDRPHKTPPVYAATDEDVRY